ncbi:EAL domain-containing protein [Thalassotalea aquiviva]|uniref:EAL domain-containing protein n=1 Tax=Thalassotalea aquiviva TaxID=3242415 RepID=UPI00352A7F1B
MKKKLYSLKIKIVFFFVLLLLIVQGFSFYTTQISNEQGQQKALDLDISRAKLLLQNELKDRDYYLSAFSETAAKDQLLRQALKQDNRHLPVALNEHRKRIDADFAVAIDANGVILGQLVMRQLEAEIKRVTTGRQIGQPFSQKDWLKQETQINYFAHNGNIYHMVISPIWSETNIIGHVGFGHKINQYLAKQLASLTGFNIALSLINGQQWTWLATSEANRNNLGESFQVDFSPIQNAPQMAPQSNAQPAPKYVFSNYPLSKIGDKTLVASLYRLSSEALPAQHSNGFNFFNMLSLMLVIALIGSYFIALSITTPLKRLVEFSKAITQGEYDGNVNVGKTKELNLLATQLSKMQEAIQEREKEVSEQAYFDSLTKLPNRNQFYLDIKRATKSFTLCQINVRRLSDINDTLGHNVGDEVIQETALRLSHLKFPIYQTSGNGFLVKFEDQEEVDVHACIRKISNLMEPVFIYQNIALHLQVNIGLTHSNGGTDPSQLLKEVDSAMQLAKRQNSLYQMYDKQIDLNTLDRLQLVNRIKPALESDEFILYYQPKLNLKTQSIEEVEALVRWQHPVHGLIAPDGFIQLTEQTGQMKALSLWVINQALEQYFIWQAKGIELRIAINISPDNLLDDDFCNLLISKLCGRKTLNKALTFEITEDAFIDHSSKAADNIRLLKQNGIYLSLDDYGTGYSSLAQLKNLSVQELKIDKCFIQNLTFEPIDKLIVTSTLNLSHQLGLSVVAEGVEDKETLDWLIKHDCEKVQGYYISRPVPADELYSWVQQAGYRTVTPSPIIEKPASHKKTQSQSSLSERSQADSTKRANSDTTVTETTTSLVLTGEQDSEHK